MNLENIIRKLETEGIYASSFSVNKNGVIMEGIGASYDEESKIMPIIYCVDGESEEDYISRICNVVQKTAIPEMKSMDYYTSKQYLMENVQLAIRKAVAEDVVSLAFLDLRLCLKLHIKGFPGFAGEGSVLITKPLVEQLGLDLSDLYAYAFMNTQKRIVVKSMAERLGIPDEDDADNPFPLYVFTTYDDMDGASALAVTETFEQFCRAHNAQKLILFPSSTEEILAVPITDVKAVDPAWAVQMVDDINASCVRPELQLNPTVYLYEFGDEVVSIFATKERDACPAWMPWNSIGENEARI